jgi:cyclase
MRILKSVLVVAALALCAVVLRAHAQQTQQQAPAAPPQQTGPAFNLKQIGPDVYAAISNPGSGGNTGFVIGDDGVLVVDTFQTAKAANELLATIRQTTQKPNKYVVNTHYHLDHTFGNNLFASNGATIMAEHNVREWIHTENPKFFGANITDAQKKMVADLTPPSIVYTQGLDVFLGSRRVEVRVFPGHTGGDSVVYIPDANVVFTGDIFWCHSLPNTIDASTAPLMETLATLVATHPDATFVPGHGQLGTAKDVREFRSYISDLRDAVKAAQSDGKSGQALTDAVVASLKDKYGSWGAFDRFAPLNAAQTAAELAGTKRIPVPVQ